MITSTPGVPRHGPDDRPPLGPRVDRPGQRDASVANLELNALRLALRLPLQRRRDRVLYGRGADGVCVDHEAVEHAGDADDVADRLRGLVALSQGIDLTLEDHRAARNRRADPALGDPIVPGQRATDPLGELGVRGRPDAGELDLHIVRDVEHALDAVRGFLRRHLHGPRGDRPGQADHATRDRDADIGLGDARIEPELLEDVVLDLPIGLVGLHAGSSCIGGARWRPRHRVAESLIVAWQWAQVASSSP